MKSNSVDALLFLTIFTFLVTGCRQKPVDVYDGFEGRRLSSIWQTNRMERHAFEIQSEKVYKGKSAAKITLRTGDVAEAATATDKATERDELLESESLFSVEGKKYEYEFNLFLPENFPIVPVRLVIAQWKQDCPFCACSEYNPILAVRYVSGKLFVTLKTDSVRHILYETNQEIRNKWHNFRFQVRFSRRPDGEIDAFLDNEKIIAYTGITSYSESCGLFSDKNKYYFKMGLYRDRMPEPMSIYIDEYRKRELKE